MCKPQSDRKLRVGVVGAGYFAQFHHEAWARMPEVELVGICDADLTKASEAAATCGCSAAFSDASSLVGASLDVLDIVTPPPTHFSLVELACLAGVPTVICQKPLAPTLQESVALVEMSERYPQTTVVVHENFRFQPWFLELKKLLEDRAVGDVYSAVFRLRPGDGQGSPPAYCSRQPYFKDMERFIIHETGIHLIDVFRFLFGEIESVYAELRRLNDCIAGEDAGTAVFTLGTVMATLDCNRLMDHDAENCRLTMGEMLIEGSEGALRLDGRGRIFLRRRESAEKPGSSPQFPERQHEFQWQPIGFGGDCVYNTCVHVAEHLLHASPLANTARQYLSNVEAEEAVYLSSMLKKRLTLPTPVPLLEPSCIAGDIRTDLGEAGIWDNRRGQYLWVDIWRARVFSLNPETGATVELDFSEYTEHISAIVPVEGSLSECVVGTTEGMALIDLDTGAFTPHASQARKRPLLKKFERMNEGKCDPQGRFWIGSVAKAGHVNAPSVPGAAALYRLDGWEGDEPPEKVIAPATICNGIAWTPDCKTMYWIDSPTLNVVAFDFDAETGNVSNRRVVVETLEPAELVEAKAFPDGLCLDTQGMLWVCIYNVGEVRRFDPRSGKLLAKVKLPREAYTEITSCAFAGPDLDELYITTAHKMFSAEQKLQMPLAGGLFKVSREELAKLGAGIRGLHMTHFKR